MMSKSSCSLVNSLKSPFLFGFFWSFPGIGPTHPRRQRLCPAKGGCCQGQGAKMGHSLWKLGKWSTFIYIYITVNVPQIFFWRCFMSFDVHQEWSTCCRVWASEHLSRAMFCFGAKVLDINQETVRCWGARCFTHLPPMINQSSILPRPVLQNTSKTMDLVGFLSTHVWDNRGR